MVKHTLAFIFSIVTFLIYAQNNEFIGLAGTGKFCDVEIEKAKLLSERPELGELEKIAQQKLEKKFLQKKQAYKNGRVSNQTYVLPIVFHIVHGGGPENISDEQVEDAVRVLNEDFQLLNADTADVHPEFKNHIGNTNIEFRLARLDPSGNPTNGINRYYEPSLTVGAGEQSKVGGWNRAKYVNIWVVRNIGSGAAGYTFIPAWADGYPEGDGIIVLHDYVGRNGTGAPSRSRTLTHEVGHWINLFHTWGQTNSPGVSQNCSDDDFVDDTPNTRGSGNCVNRVNTCSNVDPYYGKDQIDNMENYMEYTFCYNMFTKEQALRMRAATESSVAERNKLWSESNLKETGVFELTAADFSAGDEIFCWDEQVVFFDRSKYGAETWLWDFPNGNIGTSNAKNPSVKFVKPGIKAVNLAASNGSVTKSITKSVWALPEIGNVVPFQLGFENETDFEQNVFIPYNSQDSINFSQTRAAYLEGKRALMLKNYLADTNKVDKVIIGPVDVTPYEDFYINWKYAFAQKDSTNTDVLNVYTSGDCGNSWTRKNQIIGKNLTTAGVQSTEYFPSSTQDWKTSGVSGFTTVEKNSENLLVKVEFISGGGNNLFLDDFRLEGQYKEEPVLAYPRNGAENVGANVKIDWKATGLATGYQFQLDKAPLFNTNFLKSGTTVAINQNPNNQDTEFQLTGLTTGETYYWRVRSLINGNTSNWSETWSFTVSENGVKVFDIRGEKQLKFYPNPANHFIAIELQGQLTNINLQIVDISGKVVVTQKLAKSRTNIPLNELSNGVYFMKFSANNFQKVEKLIVQ